MLVSDININSVGVQDVSHILNSVVSYTAKEFGYKAIILFSRRRILKLQIHQIKHSTTVTKSLRRSLRAIETIDLLHPVITSDTKVVD